MTEQAPFVSDTLSPPPEIRQWLADLSRDPARAMAGVRLLAEHLGPEGLRPGPALFEAFELARTEQLTALEHGLRHVQTAVFPLSESSAAKLRRALAELRAAAAIFRHHHEAFLGREHARPPLSEEGDEAGLEAVALARALDMQTRLLQLQLLHRIDVPAEHWSEITDLAGLLRASRSPDLPISDPMPLFKQATARGLFVYPLLLLTADLTRRLPAEADLIDKLARAWAGKVGYRVDPDGRLHDNPHGPTILVGVRRAVRLDAHRLQRRLENRIALVEGARHDSDLRLPRGLSRERMLGLLRELEQTWSAAYLPRRWPLGLAERVSLRFGLPTLSEPVGQGLAFHGFDVVQRFTLPTDPASPAAPREGQGEAGRPPVAGGRSTPDPERRDDDYVYGRLGQDTFMRASLGLEGDGQGAQGGGSAVPSVVDFIAEGEAAWCVGREDARWSIERQSLAPVKGGELVTVQSDADGEVRRHLGWIERLLQGGGLEPVGPAGGTGDGQAPPDPADVPRFTPRYQRVGLRMWPGQAEVVGLRLAGTTFFEEVLQILASAQMPGCVVLTPGRWRTGGPATLRLPLGERSVEFVRVLHRGPGYEVVETRLRDVGN